MKKQKILAAIVAAAMSLSLSSCGFHSSVNSGSQNSSTESVDSLSESDVDNSTTTSLDESDKDSSSSSSSKSIAEKIVDAITTPKLDTSASIEKTVIYDENGLKITANKLEYNSYDVKVKVTLENNTSEKVEFLINGSNTVNGYMTDGGYCLKEVSAGESVDESVKFDMSGLLAYGFDKIADITLRCTFYSGEGLDRESTFVTTKTLKTQFADTYDYSKDTFKEAINDTNYQKALSFKLNKFEENVLYDDGIIKNTYNTIITKEYSEEDTSTSLMLDITKSGYDQKSILVIENVKINGESVEERAYDYMSVYPNTRSFMSINLDYLLEKWENHSVSISDIKTIEFTLEHKDENYKTISSSKISIVA